MKKYVKEFLKAVDNVNLYGRVFVLKQTGAKRMDKVAEHNLGAGWIMEQYCNDKGVESFKFHNFVECKCITLPNDSVKTLRAIFKNMSK